MRRSPRSSWFLPLACAGLLACGGTGSDTATTGSGGVSGSGGTTTSSGGAPGSGGGPSSGSGGAGGSGGSGASSGGAPGSGGGPSSGSGGDTGTGGSPRMGGSGGAHASGGSPGAGGNAAGGRSGTASGGASGSAGKSGTGGAASGGSGNGGIKGSGGTTSTGAGGQGGVAAAFADCPLTGHVTYTLTRSAQPTADESAAYDKIVPAMDQAVAYYDCFTSITKADTVTYNSSVATADGNVNGSIRFGSTDSMNYITAMHEISHTVGIGSATFDTLVVNGIFTGTNATAQLRAITGNATDQVHADTQHFWPNGLNYTTEVTSVPQDLINHCLMVTAIRKDMGM